MHFFARKYDDWSDEALMTAVAQKADDQALTALYRRYATRLYRYFLRMLWGDQAKAEDFTQELFLKLVEKPHLFDSNRPFSVWIFAIATNMCKNDYRRKYPQLVDDWATYVLDESLEFDFSALDAPLYAEQLQQAIDALDWNHRQCFILRYQEELSVKAVSEILDCPEGTVKSRLHYALKKITQHLENWKKHA